MLAFGLNGCSGRADGLEGQFLTLMVISSRHMREDVLMSSVVYLMVIEYASLCCSGGSCILTSMGSRLAASNTGRFRCCFCGILK